VFYLFRFFFSKKKGREKMGCFFAKSSLSQKSAAAIEDRYETIEQVYEGLRESGLEGCQLIIAIDFTNSNATMHPRTFGGRSLHLVDPNQQELNPYQRAIHAIAATLEKFDPDRQFPFYGFGDVHSKANTVFNIKDRVTTGAALIGNDDPCHGLVEVDYMYRLVAPSTQMDGPTSFAAAIYKAIEIVKATKEYHVLLIIADGQLTDDGATYEAVQKASHYPLSIVIIGVGDGPWKLMYELDDHVKNRLVDNVQFVDFTAIDKAGGPYMESRFAIAALQELPAQYKFFRSRGMI
jgi:hypothetical protein